MSQLPENGPSLPENGKNKGSPSNFGEPLLYLIVSFQKIIIRKERMERKN